jgi:hypothetical protein
MIDLAQLTWPCMVCRDERPDRAISVAYRTVAGMEDQFPDARWNVRYCNDRPTCAATAHAPGPWQGGANRARIGAP